MSSPGWSSRGQLRSAQAPARVTLGPGNAGFRGRAFHETSYRPAPIGEMSPLLSGLDLDSNVPETRDYEFPDAEWTYHEDTDSR